jgi:hypothetical protein
MTIKIAQIWLNLGYKITRKSWDNKKYLSKSKQSSTININENDKQIEYSLTKEDYNCRDWMLYQK